MFIRRITACTAVALAAAGAAAWPAGAHFDDSERYSRSEGNCSKRVDPVTVVFYGSGAYYGNVLEHVEYHTRWRNDDGSKQAFSDHGRCRKMSGQTAQSGNLSSRYHVRFHQRVHRDEKGRWETVATPHHEDLTGPHLSTKAVCHAVDKGTKTDPTKQGSGFDMGRKELTRIMAKGTPRHHHRFSRVYWGNTQSFKQCDDDLAGSNGWVNWIRVPSYGHGPDERPN